MVRGRRVRSSVVACARDEEEICSPHAKRKDQKPSVNGKLSHNTTKTKITTFFQVVEIEHNGQVKDKSVPSTPVIPDMALKDTSSPATTPHRITLCPDDLIVVDVTKAVQKVVVPKAKRRLKTNQEVNKQNGTTASVTSYFPVRRSERKTEKNVKEEKQRTLEHTLRNGIEDGLEVRNFEGKGRGVVAAKHFQRGDFVVEYSGDLVEPSEAKQREEKYSQDQNTGCYMYYFKHAGHQYCIDATAETGKLGRLVNHSRNGNLQTRTVLVDGKPRLVLVAKDEIRVGEEVLYDYGDRSKESLRHHPWLAY